MGNFRGQVTRIEYNTELQVASVTYGRGFGMCLTLEEVRQLRIGNVIEVKTDSDGNIPYIAILVRDGLPNCREDQNVDY